MQNDDTQVQDDTLQEETSEEVEETSEESTEEQETTDWKAEAKKWESIAKRNKAKSEKKVEAETQTQDFQLSPKDYLSLQESGISADDFDEVQDFAKYKGLTISEALKTSTLKTILSERKEERQTAQATSTKGARGTKPKTGEDYLEKAKTTGEIPTDDKAMQELILAKQNARRVKR